LSSMTRCPARVGIDFIDVRDTYMQFCKLVKFGELKVEDRTYPIRYFVMETSRGLRRYSSELMLGPTDRIIVDGSSLTEVESKIARLGPATIYSRLVARQAA